MAPLLPGKVGLNAADLPRKIVSGAGCEQASKVGSEALAENFPRCNSDSVVPTAPVCPVLTLPYLKALALPPQQASKPPLEGCKARRHCKQAAKQGQALAEVERASPIEPRQPSQKPAPAVHAEPEQSDACLPERRRRNRAECDLQEYEEHTQAKIASLEGELAQL